MKNKIIVILLIGFIGCKSSKHGILTDKISTFDNLKMEYVLNLEKEYNSKDISRNRKVGLGKGIYPNENNYELEISKDFLRFEKPDFKLTIDYYYTKDSTIRVILYEWNDLKHKFGDLTHSKEENDKRREIFKLKYEEISSELTEIYGEPTEVEINSVNNHKGNFRDGYKWLDKNEVNAYLFIFGNEQNTFNRIRLAIYKD